MSKTFYWPKIEIQSNWPNGLCVKHKTLTISGSDKHKEGTSTPFSCMQVHFWHFSQFSLIFIWLQIGCCPASENITKLPNWGCSPSFCSSFVCSSFFSSSFFAPCYFVPRFLLLIFLLLIILLLCFLLLIFSLTAIAWHQCIFWWASIERIQYVANIKTSSVICQGLGHYHNRMFGHIMCHRIHQNNVSHEIHTVLETCEITCIPLCHFTWYIHDDKTK